MTVLIPAKVPYRIRTKLQTGGRYHEFVLPAVLPSRNTCLQKSGRSLARTSTKVCLAVVRGIKSVGVRSVAPPRSSASPVTCPRSNAHAVACTLGQAPRSVAPLPVTDLGRVGSGVRVSASYQKNCPHRGSVKVRTSPPGSDGVRSRD